MRISDWSSDVCSSYLVHAGLVDHQHVAVGQQFAALVPLIFKAGDRPRGDSRSAFQIFGRDPRQGRAAHMIALMLPRLARHPQHRRLAGAGIADRSEEHTSELQSLMRISYAVFCLKKKT